MLFALIVCTVMAVAYIVYSMIESKGVPESISATYYILGDKGWMFQVAMICIGMILMPVWFELAMEHLQWTVFISCGGLLFVGAAPAFRLDLQGAVHYTAAAVCCIGSLAWQILEGLWDLTLFFGFFGGILAIQWRNQWCWWLECAVVGSVFANLWRIV